MNLTGSRPILIANPCALVAASVVVVEMHYIEYERFGIIRPVDSIGPFVPAIVMFIIRSRILSYCFLLFYTALSVQMFFQARDVYLGAYRIPGAEKMPFSYLAIFLAVSICSLAIYAAGALIWLAISRLVRAAREQVARMSAAICETKANQENSDVASAYAPSADKSLIWATLAMPAGRSSHR
jgi:hypothetical protein